MTIEFDLVAVTGSYTDKQGNEKKRYENVGQVHSYEGRRYITLKATFNPAGLPRKEGDDRVFLNMFVPKEKPQQSPQQNGGEARSSGGAFDDMNDDIPF